MEYFTNLIKKAIRSTIVTTVLILVLWGTLYHLTDFNTVACYFLIGVAVCILNTWLYNVKKRKIETIFRVQGHWIIMSGVVLVLYHSEFTAAAVFAAAVIFASPFFGATIAEGIVGMSLLMTMAYLNS